MSEPTGYTSLLLTQQNYGDTKSRNDLIEYACQRLKSLTCRMMKDFMVVKRWEETDDVLNKALVRLNSALSESVPQSSRHFWNLAAQMVQRELIDMARHYRGKYSFSANHHTDKKGRAADDPGGPLCTSSDSGDDSPTFEEWQIFHDLVEKLPENERSVFKQIYYEGRQQNEVAEILNISVRTVQRRWQKANIEISKGLDQAN